MLYGILAGHHFLLAVSLSASWQISFGPYVADYSRYLPTKTSSTRVFWAVGLGSLIGSQISMMLGVFIAQVSNGGFVGNEVQYVVGMNPIALVITFYILVLRSKGHFIYT